MGAATSSDLLAGTGAPVSRASRSQELDALVRRYGGGDASEPAEPEQPAPVDDYDPRKPEYIVQASEEEHEDRAVVQLRQQMDRLKAALSRRRLDPGSPVVRHYERVLDDMQRAVDAEVRKRSNMGVPRSDSVLSACSGYLTRIFAAGDHLRAIIDSEMVAFGAALRDEVAGRMRLQEAARAPSPGVSRHRLLDGEGPMPSLPGDTEDSPTSTPLAEGGQGRRRSVVEENGEDDRKKATEEVRCLWVQSGPVVCHTRILEMRVLPARPFCTILYPPMIAAAPVAPAALAARAAPPAAAEPPADASIVSL